MLSKYKVSPLVTASSSASILDTICNTKPNSITNPVRHRIRELKTKIEKIIKLRTKPLGTKRYLENIIKTLLDVREISKELEVFAIKVGKLGNKTALPNIKNATRLAKAARKSALENIKISKVELLKFKE